MPTWVDGKVLTAIAGRTFKHAVQSPIAYIFAIFFYLFVGGIFGMNYFANNQASINDVEFIAPWVLWFVVPALTMGLISEEIRTGTFEQLSTLPVRDWEIVLGKFFGFAGFTLAIIGGLIFYPIVAELTTKHSLGVDWGASFGALVGIYLVSLFFGAMGLFASSLAKNQVVAFILGVIFCTFFFFLGQFYMMFPGFLSRVADAVGVVSHMNTLGRGVWDLRDLLYFLTGTLMFLYLTVQRLTTRRF